jgi:hypothetical protein
MNEYELLRSVLSDRVIAFHPRLALAFGGVNEALIFQQLAYWSGKGDDPEWIYKTRDELKEETTLSRTQQEGARASPAQPRRDRGAERRGMPPAYHFRVNWDARLRTAVQSAENLPT